MRIADVWFILGSGNNATDTMQMTFDIPKYLANATSVATAPCWHGPAFEARRSGTVPALVGRYAS